MLSKFYLNFSRVIFASMMIFWYWEAMLVSYLAIRVISLPFTNLDEMLLKSNYHLGIASGSTVEDTFKLSKNEIYQRIWNERILPKYDLRKEYPHAMIMLNENPNMAYYGNYFSSRYFRVFYVGMATLKYQDFFLFTAGFRIKLCSFLVDEYYLNVMHFALPYLIFLLWFVF